MIQNYVFGMYKSIDKLKLSRKELSRESSRDYLFSLGRGCLRLLPLLEELEPADGGVAGRVVHVAALQVRVLHARQSLSIYVST